MKKDKENIEDFDLKSEAPILSKIGKKNSFNVSDKYFEDFSKKINKKIVTDKGRVISLNRRMLISLTSIAAVLMIGIFLFSNILLEDNKEVAQIGIEELSESIESDLIINEFEFEISNEIEIEDDYYEEEELDFDYGFEI